MTSEQVMIVCLIVFVFMLAYNLAKTNRALNVMHSALKVNVDTGKKFRDWSFNELKNCHMNISQLRLAYTTQRGRLNRLESEDNGTTVNSERKG